MSEAYAPLLFAALSSFVILIIGGAIFIITCYVLASNLSNRLKNADLEKREMKTQLIIAGKLAEVGEMSTGIAHEINNPLQVITSELAMIKDVTAEIEKSVQDLNPEELLTLKDATDQIELQVERCGKITQGLLHFARKKEVNGE